MKHVRIPGFAVAALPMLLMMSANIDAAAPSGTLPVLYINTANGAPVTSKEYYLAGTYYVDPCGVEGVEAAGSAEAPLPLQIRGRGNYTWVGFDKKPYRLKLDSKAPLLGMKKSRHFALLAHADDNLGFMRNVAGMELSRRMGLAWTPDDEPVEVVLNGDYIGLYYLTEPVRVDKDRVNVVEQADGETDPLKITGGWLVEIDNYDSDPHVQIQEGGGTERIIFTYKTPETLSAEQENYLLSQVTAMDNAIYAADKNSTEWQNLIDIDELARYYVVQEIMDDCESFHGSCYMHRDMGVDSKWNFGPVWDFGNSFHRGGKSRFIYDRPEFHQTWIGEIAKYPAFQATVREVWAEFAATGSEGFYEKIDAEISRIAAAAKADSERWPDYGNADMESCRSEMTGLLKGSMAWLGEQWGAIVPEPLPTIYLRGEFNGWQTTHPMTAAGNNLYVIENIDIDATAYNEFKVASADWSTVDYGMTPGVEFEIGKSYPLTEHGLNIILPRSLSKATFTFDYNGKTLLVNDASSGIGKTYSNAAGYTVSSNLLTATMPVVVYSAAGVTVWSGTGSVVLQPAVYIVKTADGHVGKQLIH